MYYIGLMIYFLEFLYNVKKKILGKMFYIDKVEL